MSDPAGVSPPAKYRHAFIVTYGRSGSTLLQGVLNALPGYLIRGENFDAMRHLEVLFSRMPRIGVQRGGDPFHAASPTTDPFFGFEGFTDDRIAAAIAGMLDRLLLFHADAAAVRCLGFKEIRYTPQNLDKKLAFLRQIYPDSAVLYNTRRPEDVVRSEFQKDKEVGYFHNFNALLEEHAGTDPHGFLVRYEDVAKGTGTLLGLHDFLGEPFDRARMEAVLAVKHSYHVPAEGQFYSDFPRFVEVSKTLRGVSLLVVDRFETLPTSVRLGGLLVAAEPGRRIATIRDEQNRSIQFRGTFNQASPALAKRLAGEAARMARFEVFYPRGGSDEHRLFLDDGDLAMTVRADSTPSG